MASQRLMHVAILAKIKYKVKKAAAPEMAVLLFLCVRPQNEISCKESNVDRQSTKTVGISCKILYQKKTLKNLEERS